MLREEASAAHMYDRGASAGGDARSEGFDLKEKIKVVRRRRRLIAITTVLITSVVALVALSLPPRYTTVASVLIEQRRTNVMNTESVVEEQNMDSRALAAELNLLRSRTYAEKVVKELDLLSSPAYNPSLQGGPESLTILAGRLSAVWTQVPESWRVAMSSRLPDSWLIAVGLAEQPQRSTAGADRGAVEASPNAVKGYSMPPPGSEAYEYLMQSAVRTLLGGLRISAGGSNLILIEATAGDPREAAEIADTVAELYVQDQLEIKRQAVDEAVDWLKERVDNLRERVLTSEGAVVTYQEKHGLATVSTTRQEAGPGQELISVRAERAKKEELLEWVRGLRERGAALDTIAAVLSLPTLADLREQEMDLQRQESMLRMKYGNQHREILQLDAGRHPINIQREHLAARFGGEIRAAIRKLEGEIAFARRQEQDLEERLGQNAAGSIPGGRAEVQLRDLQRQAEADRSLYVAFLNRFKEVSEQQNLLEAGAKVGSRAGIPGDPEFPKPGLMTVAGFTVSLTLGTLLAFLIEYLDSGLRTGRQVERVLGLPNLGFIPHVSKLESGQKLHRHLIKKPRSAYTEAIRRIQIATVDAIEANQTSLVVLVTSSLPGEGKTTLALSLGASAACSGRKAVVVDLDLRRPRLHSETDLMPDVGILEFLAGDNELNEVIYPSGDHASLDIVPVSSLPESPADLVRSPRMACLITQLRARYEYVVLDSPPLIGVVDAKLVARLVDAVLFVARWEKTNETAARTGLQNLVDRHTPPIGAVLTQVDFRRHASQGYGESVQYYSKYQAYYK